MVEPLDPPSYSLPHNFSQKPKLDLFFKPSLINSLAHILNMSNQKSAVVIKIDIYPGDI